MAERPIEEASLGLPPAAKMHRPAWTQTLSNRLFMRPTPRGEGRDGIVPAMSLRRNYWPSLAGVLMFGLGGALLGGSVSAQAPAEITSDTPEYCLHLLDRVSALVNVAPAPPPQEVTALSAEGQRMCDHGQVRGGIMRLRHALLLMQQHGANEP
jgi:hypothetical protein